MVPTAAEFVVDSVDVLGHAASEPGFPGEAGWRDFGAALTYDLFGTREEHLAASAELIASKFPMHQSFSRRFMGNLLIDADWRFAESTLERIAATIPREDVLLLGAPTLHQYLVSHGNDSRLIDRNGLYRGYFDDTANANFIVADVCSTQTPLADSKFSAVFFDAPWTLSAVSSWASVAVSHLRRGGTLYMTLFPPSVRPRAADEIRMLREALAATFATSEFYTISYDTPTFEVEILRRKGIVAPGHWRVGFLVRLGGYFGTEPPPTRPESGAPPTASWRRKVDDGKVVAVRYHDLAERKFQFLDSVSSRHHLFRDFDFIDSANKIGADVDAPYW